jgi:Protein of unknown function (DUF429)
VPFRLPPVKTVIGVDYSGAAQSGRNAWLAETAVISQTNTLELAKISPIGRLACDDSRESINDYLADRIGNANQTLFGMDFPFGLPIELNLGSWPKQLESLRKFKGDAKAYGHFLVARTEKKLGTKHVRRATDREASTPFDCYHYRIIYQTFHGMRDVLAKVADDEATAVWPFQYERDAAKRIVVEACPSSTLKRLGLPHRLYKQSGDRPIEPQHQKNRQLILQGIQSFISIKPHQRRILMTNPGGDALDAVLAAVGSWHAFMQDDHSLISKHTRYPLEGRVYC